MFIESAKPLSGGVNRVCRWWLFPYYLSRKQIHEFLTYNGLLSPGEDESAIEFISFKATPSRTIVKRIVSMKLDLV